ncbi:MAG: hypothetical protein KatS3mg028_0450 [Bacteroidia bacterium]|nr:MAG: hypothetical protein KatS3mg028_0450 [Bacteroidia bacterium]
MFQPVFYAYKSIEKIIFKPVAKKIATLRQYDIHHKKRTFQRRTQTL